jgi:hypothetical protein
MLLAIAVVMVAPLADAGRLFIVTLASSQFAAASVVTAIPTWSRVGGIGQLTVEFVTR